MEVGDLVVRNPTHWAGGLDEIGIIIDCDEHDDEIVVVQWAEDGFIRHYTIYDLEVYHESR